MVTMHSIIAREQENINRRKRLKQCRIIVDNNIENVYYDILGYEGYYYYISINRNDIVTTDVSRIGDRLSCSAGYFIIVDIVEKEYGLELKIAQVNPEVVVHRINIELLKDQIEEANEDTLEKQMLIQDIYL